MKKPNPFIPQGSCLDDTAKHRRKAHFVVFAGLAALIILVLGLLIEGCRHPSQKTEGSVLGSAETAPSSITTAPSTGTAPPTSNRTLVAAPTPSPAFTPPAPEQLTRPRTSARSYSVVKGDSFFKIARANGIAMSALANANPGVDSAKLKVGQTLQIPIATATPAPPASSEKNPLVMSSNTFYIVKSGDLLSQIARKHGTTVKALRAANGLKTDRILVGQKLRLPQVAASTEAPAPQEVSYE
jgi:LysM repeat protein